MQWDLRSDVLLTECVTEVRIAVVQLLVTKVKADNLQRAWSLVKEAAGQGAKVVVLPVSMIW